MSYSKLIFLIAFSAGLTSCAVSQKPEEQSSMDVIIGSSTGQFETFIKEMRIRLKGLNERANGISQVLDDYNAQLYLAKRDLEKYQISEKERDKLQAEIASFQLQTEEINRLNQQSQALIAARESEIEQKSFEQNELKSSIETAEKQLSNVEKQTIVIEDGIKRIAAIRAKNTLTN
ncbi:MAG: hypothetical protein ABJV04_03420 [Aliiglaciecola sp.]|uniref:hypothetical protein n=1 Tax=Aliiglaciecola sp. TaxID=1872441 RepID=UPI00329819C0